MNAGQCPLSLGEFNRSVQHLLILLGEEVHHGDVTDSVHGYPFEDAANAKIVAHLGGLLRRMA